MKLKKLILSIFLSLIFIFPILENLFAESVYNLETSSFDNEITPYATYISSADCNLNITGGSAYVNGIVKGYSNVTKTSVTLKLQQIYRESTQYILDSRITLPNGKNIKISDIATFKVEEGPSKLEKKDKRKKIVLYANLDDNLDLKTAQNMIVETLEEMGKPDSVTYGYGGKSADMAEMSEQLIYTFGIAIFLIYFILVWQFESFIMPFIIILSIPLSTTGAFYALYGAGLSIDAMVSVGFVMLAGIVVNNAIVLIDFINLRREAGDSKNKAIITSGRTRLRPILMTTLTTVLGMLPLMFSNGEGSEMYKGMSFVVVFGLSTATLLTLIVIPVFYYLIDDFTSEWIRFLFSHQSYLPAYGLPFE